MSAGPELLPCPFCGGVVEIERGSNAGAIQCVGSSSCLRTGLLIGFHLAQEDSAIAAWNRRAALSDHPTVKALVDAAVAAERERLLRPDLGFVCECGMSGPCMADNCKSPILDMTAAIRGETT